MKTILLMLFLITQMPPASQQKSKFVETPHVLFDGKSLAGWTTYVDHKDKSIDPRTDPKRVFEVEAGVIHVSGEEFGGLTTKEEFENYRLAVEFRWGKKKWPPRDKVVRDSGILMHCVGPDKV